MNYRDIKNFIEDFKHNSHFYSTKDIFSQFFLRGNFKKGFTLLFKKDLVANYEPYYFKLDSEDVDYLLKKYTPIYENIKEQEKLAEIEAKKSTIKRLTEELERDGY